MPLGLDHVAFSYLPDRPVLRDLTASLAPAAVTVIIGPNGAGKSTLLRLLLGALTPTSGSVRLDEAEVHRIPPRRRAARLAFIPQAPSLSEAFTVAQVVRLGRYARRADDSAIGAAMRTMELTDLSDEPFGTLSAGQQQRVTLARALAQLAGSDPAPARQAILADEPCAAMDPRHALHAMSVLRAQARRGMTVVIVLHDFSAALRFADHALVLDGRGRLAAHGPVAEALTAPMLRGVFGVEFDWLGAPNGDGRSWALVPRAPAADTIGPS